MDVAIQLIGLHVNMTNSNAEDQRLERKGERGRMEEKQRMKDDVDGNKQFKKFSSTFPLGIPLLSMQQSEGWDEPTTHSTHISYGPCLDNKRYQGQ